MCRVLEAESWDVVRNIYRTARTEHQCGECHRTIKKGESYEYTTGMIDSHWSSFYTCGHCKAASKWLDMVCGGYMMEEILEELDEHWYEYPEFRSLWLARVIAGMRHQWNNGRMEVPELPPIVPNIF